MDRQYETMNDVKKHIDTMDPSESLVGLFEVENERKTYLAIGNSGGSNLWSLTEGELLELHLLLQKRYKK